MKSIKDVYKIGKGPSSSHTMGPFKAVRHYLDSHEDTDRLHVTLYGSLAATGKGHLTDIAIQEAFSTWCYTDKETLECKSRRCGDVTIEWKPKEFLQLHPNGMKIASINSDGDLYDRWTYYSIGGGDIICMENPLKGEGNEDIYPMTTLTDIMNWCNNTGKNFWEYVEEIEGKDSPVWEHLELVWKVMQPLAHTHIVDALAVGNNITSLRATILYLDVEQLLHGIGIAVELTLRKLLATPKVRLITVLYLFERDRPSIIDGRHEPHIAVDKSCGTHSGRNFR
mgnify:CR=1 FL=1